MSLSTLEYFNLRADRYGNAIKELKNARILDLIPYSYFIKKNFNKKKDLKILDAFGGTGFLTQYFLNIASEIVVADQSDEMINRIKKKNNIKKRITTDDFQSIIEEFGENYFDVVITHGGIHHSIIINKNNQVDTIKSQDKQNLIVKRLSKLTAKGGLLILADLAQDKLDNFSIVDTEDFSLKHLSNLLSSTDIQFISSKLNINLNQKFTYIDFLTKIHDTFSTKTNYKVPHHFFDSYISRYSRLGHVAYYSNFKLLEESIENFIHLSRSNFKLPWIFDDIYSAGWFFKEKFSIFNKTTEIKISSNEKKMFSRLKKYLGCKEMNSTVYVNWAVTYSVFKKVK